MSMFVKWGNAILNPKEIRYIILHHEKINTRTRRVSGPKKWGIFPTYEWEDYETVTPAKIMIYFNDGNTMTFTYNTSDELDISTEEMGKNMLKRLDELHVALAVYNPDFEVGVAENKDNNDGDVENR